MNQERDDLAMLLQELIAAVKEADLKHGELIVSTLHWTSVLLDVCREDGSAAVFSHLPARHAKHLSGCLTDVERGELIAALQSRGLASANIARRFAVGIHRVRKLRALSELEPEQKALLHELDIPESVYRSFAKLPDKVCKLEALLCLGRARARGKLPTTLQASRWTSAVASNPEGDLDALLLKAMSR